MPKTKEEMNAYQREYAKKRMEQDPATMKARKTHTNKLYNDKNNLLKLAKEIIKQNEMVKK